ncbi:DNA-3-methyladenine glycosylase [Furfurilactobacillus curtus]|uniref:Putative 3-methyladenine DNA glycosylase n=1 Tax=Furfurilactobacillus curtus TaxID=1746200 RepID=A0ABQ5JRZ2_9LACO
MPLTAAFFSGRPTDQIVKALLGTELIFRSQDGNVGGLIVEAEAYLGDEDTAAHAFGHRQTQANRALFGAPGTLYFYRMRGLILMNLICQPAGVPQGILIRALQPTLGVDLMMQNRTKIGVELTNGPAKLTAALGITDLRWNELALPATPFLLQPRKKPVAIAQSPRIGVSQGSWHDRELRFFVAGNPYLSKSRKRDQDWTTMGWQV